MSRLEVIPARLKAPAKINLALHVVGQRGDGYHLLDSLVVFSTDAADVIDVAPTLGERDDLALTGAFAAALTGDGGNILTRALATARGVLAAHGFDLPPVALTLDKRLPIASGIGGGSADAAALLRWVAAIAPVARADLMAAALGLGADVPMCLDGRPARVTGVGETVVPLASLPDLPLLLVNPNIPLATPAVFAALARRDHPPMAKLPADGFADLAALVTWLRQSRNDLETPAVRLVPEIAAISDALRAQGALFARMSGSGATVFGLFAGRADAAAARKTLAASNPGWWISAAGPDDD